MIQNQGLFQAVPALRVLPEPHVVLVSSNMDACYDEGSTLYLALFLTDGAPEPKLRQDSFILVSL